MDQPQNHTCLTQCLLIDCFFKIHYKTLSDCETPFFSVKLSKGGDPIACVHDRSMQKGRVREGKEKTEHRITPSPPTLLSVMAMGLCVFLLVCEWEKQCCPAQAAHHTSGGAEKTAWKEEGWVVFTSLTSLCVPFLQTVCGKTLWGTQTHNSFVLRHYNTPAAERRHRWLGKRVGWGLECEIDWTEELFRMRRDDDDGGRHWKRDVGSLPAITIQIILLLLPKSNIGPNL